MERVPRVPDIYVLARVTLSLGTFTSTSKYIPNGTCTVEPLVLVRVQVNRCAL
jgi:hypothetical protein